MTSWRKYGWTDHICNSKKDKIARIDLFLSVKNLSKENT